MKHWLKNNFAAFFLGALLATCVTLLVCTLWHTVHLRQEEERLSNMRPHLDEQKGSVIIVIGYSEEVPIMRFFSVNTPMDRSRMMEDKQEGHGYTFHDKELAQEAVKAAEKAIGEVALKQQQKKK